MWPAPLRLKSVNLISRSCSTQAKKPILKNKKILREFISEHLFSSRSSYFMTQAPVHSSSELQFNNMWDETDYRVSTLFINIANSTFFASNWLLRKLWKWKVVSLRVL